MTRILFVCDEPSDAQPCLQELARAHFDVAADIAIDVAGYVERLRAECDVVVSCCSMDTDMAFRALDVLQKHVPGVPFILLSPATQPGIVTLFLANGAFDWVDCNQLDLLPASVAVALESRSAREEWELSSRALKGSQALHRALIDNPTYGVCLFDPAGRLLDANQVLIDMLGYGSKTELLQQNIASDVTVDPRRGAQLLEAYRRTGQVDAQDAAWQRKDGTAVTVRLGGRHVADDSAPHCELIVYDVTADRAQESHLQQLALTDALTGLGNFRQLQLTVEIETRRSERTGRPFAILVFDLDGLKRINDGYGHVAGNRALCRLSAMLRRSCRSLDTPTRCGGDEFALVLPETAAREAGLTARRICIGLANDREQPPLSVSVGIAVYPHNGVSFETLLQNADRVLYAMKGHSGPVPVTSPATSAVLPTPVPRRHASGARSGRRPVHEGRSQK